MRLYTKFALLVGVLSLCHWAHVSAFVSNDLIPAAYRVQFNQERTAWNPIFGKACPRFGIDRTVKIVLPLDASGGSDYKIQFSFNNDQFLTSWITVMSTTENIISFAEFRFVYTGGAVIKVEHEAHHWPKETDMSIKQLKDRQLTLHYRWHQLRENDVSTGLSVLFISGFLLGGTALAISIINGAKKNHRRTGTGYVKTPAFDGGTGSSSSSSSGGGTGSGQPGVQHTSAGRTAHGPAPMNRASSAGLGSAPSFGSEQSYYNYGNSATSGAVAHDPNAIGPDTLGAGMPASDAPSPAIPAMNTPPPPSQPPRDGFVNKTE